MRRLALMNAIREALAAGINVASAGIDALVSVTGTFSGAVTADSVAADAVRAGALADAGRVSVFPGPRAVEALTGLTLDALFLFDETSGNARDATANVDLTAGATNAYSWWIGGYRGVNCVANVDGFSLADAYNPAATSQVRVTAFSAAAHNAADMGIEGSVDTIGTAGTWSVIATADDKVHVHVTGIDLTVGPAITFGDVYLLVTQIDRDADLLRARLVNLTTGVAVTASVDITGLASLDNVGNVYQLGWLNNIGVSDGMSFFGALIASGAQVEGAGFAASFTQALGLE